MEDSSAASGREECKRAPALLEASTTGTSKRRKISFRCAEEEEEDSTALSLASPPADSELRSRAALFSSGLAAVNFVPPPLPAAEFCSGDSRSSSCSCLTRFSSSHLVETLEDLHVAGDPEMKSFQTETSTCNNANFSTKNSPSSNLLSETSLSTTMETSPAQKTTAESGLRKPTATKMPPQAEVEEFFSAAEKYEQKRFMEKYNYDIVKDVPLEGRYQWVRLKP